MSWAGLASNQTVTFNNLQNAVSTGVFIAKTSIPASNECITKADANTYVNLDTTYSPYANKASNQLVVKSNLVSSSISTVLVTDNPTYSTTTLYCDSEVGGAGNYDYIQGRVTATLKDQNGNTITNILGYSVYVDIDGTATGCFNGTVPYSIEIPNGSSSGVVIYDAQKTDNCGDGAIYPCTLNTITMDCITSITNNYSVNGSSNLGYCGGPGSSE